MRGSLIFAFVLAFSPLFSGTSAEVGKRGREPQDELLALITKRHGMELHKLEE